MTIKPDTPLMKLMTKHPATLLADQMTLQDYFERMDSVELYAICKSKRGTITSFLSHGCDLMNCINEGDTWYIEEKAGRAAAAIDGEFLTNYVTYHVMADGGCLCNKCIRENAFEVLDASRDPGTDTQWEYKDTDINYEDPDLYCDNCNAKIPGSYLDDDEDEAD